MFIGQYGTIWKAILIKTPIIYQNAILKVEIDYLIGLINKALLNIHPTLFAINLLTVADNWMSVN